MVSHRKPAKPAFDPRTVKENIVETPLNEEMSKSFLEYAYSVIYARALPDARDGLKPVQRRIIYQMGQMSLNPDRPYMKSARVVGEVDAPLGGRRTALTVGVGADEQARGTHGGRR